MFETITLSIDARGVARLRLNRPDKHNAMSAAMITELTQAAGQLAADPLVRVVVLGAEGASFCAGGDLAWMRAQMQADRTTRMREATALAQMLGALDRLPQPLIGEVQGNAFGGGLGLICVCDVAYGVETARFALTETRLGLIPATIGPYVLARLGAGRARRVFLSGRAITAAEALRLDLLAEVCPTEDLADAVADEVEGFLACAPGAVAAAKALIRDLKTPVTEADITRSIEALADRWESDEAAEGIAAFFSRSAPPWKIP